MKYLVSLIAVSLFTVGCTEEKNSSLDDTSKDAPYEVVNEFSLSKKCSDGTDVYLLPDGTYATFDGTNQIWVPLSPDVSPDQYCS